jgi:hypothetical protein
MRCNFQHPPGAEARSFIASEAYTATLSGAVSAGSNPAGGTGQRHKFEYPNNLDASQPWVCDLRFRNGAVMFAPRALPEWPPLLLELPAPASSGPWPQPGRRLALVQLQPACGALGQVVPQRRAGDVPDDRWDLPGQALVYCCLLGCRAQRDLDAAAGESVIPGGCEAGTAGGALLPDSWPGGPGHGGPPGRAVAGQRQGQRVAAGPVVV